MEKPFINQIELSRRWGISHRTLERWRWQGQGPKFIKLGNRVVYAIEEIKNYELLQIRNSTSDTGVAA
mgnify:CR=1 FL=1